MADLFRDALQVQPQGVEIRCGAIVNVPRFGGQPQATGDDSVHRLFPALGLAMDLLESARQAERGWLAQVLELREEASRLRNLAATCSGLEGGRDRGMALADYKACAALLEQAEAGHTAALREIAEAKATVDREAATV